jgi:hypothetical protein
MMKTLSQPEVPFLQVLLSWSADRVLRAAASMKPKHRADQIAAEVAASGNPSGA